MRHCVLEALLEIGERAKLHADDIVALLEDDIYLVRAKACSVLGMCKFADVVDQIADLLVDISPSVRAAALLAIGDMGEDGGDVAPKVYKYLSDPVGSVRAA